MSFELKHKETVPEGVRRVARERVERAIDALDGRKSIPDEAVHEARKRLREVRGALRMVRGELGTKSFSQENTIFRDASRPLSEVRDAKILIDAIDKLAEQYRNELVRGAFEHTRAALKARRRDVRNRVLGDGRTTRPLISEMRKSLRRMDDWPLQRKGWKAVAAGLARTYDQARDAMQQALKDGSDESLHEWRKRTKDLRYELELLARTWPETITPMAESAHHLTTLLGDDHDLAVLQGIVENEMDDVPDEERKLLLPLIGRRRSELQDEARELGPKLYAETPKDFVARIRHYWQNWR